MTGVGNSCQDVRRTGAGDPGPGARPPPGRPGQPAPRATAVLSSPARTCVTRHLVTRFLKATLPTAHQIPGGRHRVAAGDSFPTCETPAGLVRVEVADTGGIRIFGPHQAEVGPAWWLTGEPRLGRKTYYFRRTDNKRMASPVICSLGSRYVHGSQSLSTVFSRTTSMNGPALLDR